MNRADDAEYYDYLVADGHIHTPKTESFFVIFCMQLMTNILWKNWKQ